MCVQSDSSWINSTVKLDFNLRNWGIRFWRNTHRCWFFFIVNASDTTNRLPLGYLKATKAYAFFSPGKPKNLSLDSTQNTKMHVRFDDGWFTFKEAELTCKISFCSVSTEWKPARFFFFSHRSLSHRCFSRRHRHRGPLAYRHEGRDLSHRLLVQPRALLLEVQRDDVSGEGPLSTVAELGWAHNGDIRGRRTLLL